MKYAFGMQTDFLHLSVCMCDNVCVFVRVLLDSPETECRVAPLSESRKEES